MATENQPKQIKADPLGKAVIKSVIAADILSTIVVDASGGYYVNITPKEEERAEKAIKLHLARLVREALTNEQWLDEALQMLNFAHKSGLPHREAIRNAIGSFMLRTLGIDLAAPPEPPEEKPRIYVVGKSAA